MPKGSGRTNKLRYGGANEMEQQLFGGGKRQGGRTPSYQKEMNELLDAFGDMPNDTELDLNIDDMEDVYEVDVELIDKEANTLASSNVQNLVRLYNNKEFVEEHPDFRKRIDTEIESLRKLYKMAKIDEQVHDHLVTAISKNPGNASLYKALDYLQSKMLSIDKQIRDQIAGFNKIISGYQLELNFAETDRATSDDGSTVSEREDGSVISRGSKAFIESMKANTENNQLDLFEFEITKDNLPADWELDDEGEVTDKETGEVVGYFEGDEFKRY
jgi:hypothetical protein